MHTGWRAHAILSVALPAILPPPMPLSPFVLAAGALKMSRKKFLITFTVSRFLRHAAFAALGIYYGPHVLRMWNMLQPQMGDGDPHRYLERHPDQRRHRLLEDLQDLAVGSQPDRR